MSDHSYEIETDFEGWIFACCDCGWREGPFVDDEDAADAYGDHRAVSGV